MFREFICFAVLHLLFVIVQGNLPLNCRRMPDATYCSGNMSFSCANGVITKQASCDVGCLNGVCQEAPALCSRLQPFGPADLAEQCADYVRSRADPVDPRLDYHNASMVALALMQAWIDPLEPPLSPLCLIKARAIACQAAYPTCSIFNQCFMSDYYACQVGCTFSSGFNASLCTTLGVEKPMSTEEKIVFWLIEGVFLLVLIFCLCVAYYLYRRRRLDSDGNQRV
jgi:hypothetical protein